MFKQILLIALLSFSAAQAKAELGDNWIDFFWDFFDNPGTFLPDIQVPQQPLDLYEQGIFDCGHCGSIQTTKGRTNVSKRASNLIFGEDRIVNIQDPGFANLAPYANGVEGLRIQMGDGHIVEIRVNPMGDTTLSALARRNGGVVTFVIVLSDGSVIEWDLNVKFDDDHDLIPLNDEEKIKELLETLDVSPGGETNGLGNYYPQGVPSSFGSFFGGFMPWDDCSACTTETWY